MPEDPKKHQYKAKNDPKEQRRPRRSQQTPVEKKTEKKPEEPKVPMKPVYEDPGPEFYKNLKRETDEILKITEEANSKYKKKEIQSNWTKYEMPLESYDEIQEQENLGADYEELINAPNSIGGHFQFKHEKSWDISIGPSLYDKYFDIKMDDLTTALATIPFYERNSIDKAIFTQTDVLTMDGRSTKYKQKYYNDKSYTTPELEAQDKITSILQENLYKTEVTRNNVEEQSTEIRSISESKDIILEGANDASDIGAAVINRNDTKPNEEYQNEIENTIMESKKTIDNIAELSIPLKSNQKSRPEEIIKMDEKIIADAIGNKKEIEDLDDIILENVRNVNSPCTKTASVETTQVTLPDNKMVHKVSGTANLMEDSKTPAIESPEDLEKWLDDFLDS